jgi:hypothetical protein
LGAVRLFTVQKGQPIHRVVGRAALTVLLAVGATAAGGSTVAEGAPAPAASAPAAAPTGPLQAADEASAAALAYRTRQQVEVTGMTTESTRVWARPDGTFRSEVHASPERVRTDAGTWVDVDLTLERRADGTVGPKAHPRGVVLSGARTASDGPLATLGKGAEQSVLGWRGALPDPVLDGPKATYREVEPGIDLVVQVDRTGYEYSLVLKNPSAAQSLTKVAMPWSTGSGTKTVVSGDGSTGSTTAQQTVISRAVMWDDRMSTTTGDRVHQADVPVSTAPNTDGGTDLVLTPDQVFYDDPGLTWPVTIDPSVNLNPNYDAYVQSTILNSDKSTDSELKLGYIVDSYDGCGSGCTARSFLSFRYLDNYIGSTVISANLYLWNFHSYSCTPATWEAWKVGYVDYTARWNNQPTWFKKTGSTNVTKGYGSCASGWVSISVADTFQSAFSAGDYTANVGLRAYSESQQSGWKKFNSSEAGGWRPYVELVYNRNPNTPTSQTIDSCYSACASPAVVRSGTPQVSATVSDPDAGTLRAEYEVYDSAKTTLKAKSGTAVTGVASGSARPWKVVPLSGTSLPDATYNWRVRACDSYVCGAYSGWFTFTVNTQDPSLPTVSGTPYQERSTGTWNGGPGQAGTFTFGPNGTNDVAEYVYQLNGGNAVTVPAGVPQAQQLSANQQQVGTDTGGFNASSTAVLARSTARGHNSGDSLQITPTGTGSGDETYASVGGDYGGGFRLGMQAGRRYWFTGWIYVPAATGLSPSNSRGLTVQAIYKDGGVFVHTASPKPTAVDTWQKVSVVMTVPATANEAFFRIYDGSTVGSGKSVYWDDLSLREVTGTTTTETITPTEDGYNSLSVKSRNSAGTTSDPRYYDFLVTPSSGSWNWTLDDNAGTTAASVPDTRPASLSSSGATWTSPGRVGTAAVSLDGTGQLTTASPVLDTTAVAGFTVAAWVRATDLGTERTAVSQDGTNTSMFRLGFRTDRDADGDGTADPAWCFSARASDSTGAALSAACVTDYVMTGDWVSLVGIYDQTTGKLKVYVNGTPDIGGTSAEATYTGPWSATGPLAMGRANDGGPSERWIGDLDHVYAAQRVWTEDEVLFFALK